MSAHRRPIVDRRLVESKPFAKSQRQWADRKRANWSVIFFFAAGRPFKSSLNCIQNHPTVSLRWDQCNRRLSKQLIKFLGFYSEYMWLYYNAHEVLSWFPGQYKIYCPLAFRMSMVFPVLRHWLTSNRRIFMKFIYGNGVMMDVKICKDVIVGREVIAIWLPKYQWNLGDTHEYSFQCTWTFVRTGVIAQIHNFGGEYQFAIEFACLAYLYLPKEAFS